MYKRLISYVYALLIVGDTAIAAGENARERYVIELERSCVTEWGTDFRMIEYCEQQQLQALDAVLLLQEDVANDVEKAAILDNCFRDWMDGDGYDWRMVEYCAAQQMESREEVIALRDNISQNQVLSGILIACFNNWRDGPGVDWRIVAFCYDEQQGAYQRLQAR